MPNITVYIDESGTLSDPKDAVVIVAAVGTESVVIIDEILKKLKKRHLRKPSAEVKFYTAGDKTKLLFFELLTKKDFMICALIVDKIGRKIPDTPENYAALCLLLLTDVFSFATKIKEIIFDRHFSRNIDTEVFNTNIRTLVGKNIPIKHVDSIRDKRVNVADMIAGAILAKESGKDIRFYEMMKEKMTSSKRVNWREVKKRFLATKKLA